MVNDFEFAPAAHVPTRSLVDYQASSATLNLVRAFTQGGFADLRYVHDWRSSSRVPSNARYERPPTTSTTR